MQLHKSTQIPLHLCKATGFVVGFIVPETPFFLLVWSGGDSCFVCLSQFSSSCFRFLRGGRQMGGQDFRPAPDKQSLTECPDRAVSSAEVGREEAGSGTKKHVGGPNTQVHFLQNSMSHYNAGTWGIVQGQLRPLLAPRVYTLPMVRSIGKTMVQGKNYGPQITVKRISTRSAFFICSS